MLSDVYEKLVVFFPGLHQNNRLGSVCFGPHFDITPASRPKFYLFIFHRLHICRGNFVSDNIHVHATSISKPSLAVTSSLAMEEAACYSHTILLQEDVLALPLASFSCITTILCLWLQALPHRFTCCPTCWWKLSKKQWSSAKNIFLENQFWSQHVTSHLDVGKKQDLKMHSQLIIVEVSKTNWIVWGRKIYERNFSCSLN